VPPSPTRCAIASLLLPGLGQIWLGQRVKGTLILLFFPLVCCGLGLGNLLAAIDAWSLARKVASGAEIGPYENGRLAEWLGEL
jgi:TM2 domain-containing membrane protein YozV